MRGKKPPVGGMEPSNNRNWQHPGAAQLADRYNLKEIAITIAKHVVNGPFTALHDFQSRAIDACKEGAAVLVVQAAGAGKSLIYLLAGLQKEAAGLTVVVTPLKATIMQQVAILSKRELASQVQAIEITGDITIDKAIQLIQGLKTKRWQYQAELAQYVFITPEQICNTQIQKAFSRESVALLVIDEAHQIYTNRSFRPKFGQLEQTSITVGARSVLLLSATMPYYMYDRLQQDFGQRNWTLIERPAGTPPIGLRNVEFSTDGTTGVNKGLKTCSGTEGLETSTSGMMPGYATPEEVICRRLKMLKAKGGTMLVVCNRRRRAEDLYSQLQANPVIQDMMDHQQSSKIVYYNSAASAEERRRYLREFEEGSIQCMITGHALANGVNFLNVKSVV